jgi:hypothetical protein
MKLEWLSSRTILLSLAPLLAPAPPSWPAEGSKPPTLADYPPADADCRDKKKLSIHVAGRQVEFTKTFVCEMLVHSCGRPEKFTSEIRKTGEADCKDWEAAGAALQDKEICCDCERGCPGILAPHPRAAEAFERLYAGEAPGSSLAPADKIAISRFIANCATRRLLDDLSTMPCPSEWSPRPGCTMGDKLRFKLRFRAVNPSDPEAGSVAPGQPYPNPDPEVTDPGALHKFVYTVSVSRQSDGGPGETHSFPTPSDSCFSYTFSDGSSEMAKTIYHELLHIWWMNKFQTDYKNSGHGTDLGRCSNYDAEFVRRLADFYRAMDAQEKCMKESGGVP